MTAMLLGMNAAGTERAPWRGGIVAISLGNDKAKAREQLTAVLAPRLTAPVLS
jgi:hypothetical protein